MQLASDALGSPMQVAAVLVLDAPTAATLHTVRAAIADRVRAIPRFRQRLVRSPLGCGRPYWEDDATFDISRHVHGVRCPEPGGEHALLDVAAETATAPLPLDRPLWTATFVSGLAGGRSALIVVVHHVLADGIGGLAALACLLDGAPPPPAIDLSRPPPSRGQLAVDALRARLHAIARLTIGARRLRQAVAELKAPSAARAPHCSLNRPTGRRRSLGVARTELSAVRAAAHAHHASVNDVVLTAVSGALHELLRGRGEVVERFMVNIPVSARRDTTADQLGNQVGIIPVDLPATGEPLWRLGATAEITRARKTSAPGSSAAVLAPMFRVLARLGVLRWYVLRQRRVTTFVTNVRGPDVGLSFLGAPIVEIIPIGTTTGNVTVSFAVLSYAGTLVITVIADAQRCPDLPLLVDHLQRELDGLVGAAEVGPAGAG
jgi:WS/DGAT/MGAT family acyltransferase